MCHNLFSSHFKKEIGAVLGRQLPQGTNSHQQGREGHQFILLCGDLGNTLSSLRQLWHHPWREQSQDLQAFWGFHLLEFHLRIYILWTPVSLH